MCDPNTPDTTTGNETANPIRATLDKQARQGDDPSFTSAVEFDSNSGGTGKDD